MQLSFDNQQQTIMGGAIADRQCYRCVRDAMLFNVYEDWRPTVSDVQWAAQEAQDAASRANRKFKEEFQ
ncbi:hypothetical protein PS376_06375 [Limosilactobacillus pontis]|uniref:hypothetical protein n=1 Tax=Limosilactobacillus pontis TaxID=35787 RepID=UPI002F26A8E1